MEPSYNIEKKKSKIPMVIVSLIAIILLGSTVTLGILYLNEKNNQIGSKKSTQSIVEESKPVESKEISLFKASQVDELYTEVDKSKESTTYNALIGKFSLELPNWLGVIQKMDGGGEGSIETNIQIGIIDGGLIALPSNAPPVEIRAIKTLNDEHLSTPDQFKEFMKNYGIDIDNNSVDGVIEETITFADNKAIKYTSRIGGLFRPSYVAFQRGDIVYIISSDADEEIILDIEKIVESNIKFN
jgi:hypothetical protein